MSKKKRRQHEKGEKPELEKNKKAALLGVALSVLALAVYWFVSSVPPDVPNPDPSVMEPQVAEKIQAHRDAVFAEPDSHETWGKLGIVFQAHGLEAEAASCYRRAIELGPSEFRWQYLRVHALRGTDSQSALERANMAARLGTGYAPIHVLRGELLEEENEIDGAREAYEAALSIDNDCAMAAFGLGRAQLSSGNLDAALEHLTRAAELSPDSGPVHVLLARLHRRMGERELAVREANLASGLTAPVAIDDPIHFRMTRESVSSITLLARAQAAMRAGDHQRAEQTYVQLVELRPVDADMHARLADSLARQDKREEAKKEYQAALDINAHQHSALFGLGTLLSLEGHYEEAARHYRKSLEVRPDDVSTLLNLGGILVFEGKLDEADEIFRQALAAEPEGFGPHRQLGELMRRQRKYAEAIPHFRAALEVRPNFGNLHLQLAMTLASTGEFQEARQHAQRAQELGEKVPPRLTEALRKRR